MTLSPATVSVDAGDVGTETGLHSLSETECWTLLRSHGLGRVAIVVDAKPEIFPVNYVTGNGVIAFRTGPGTKLDHGPGSPAAFEVDDLAGATGTGWSVVVKGILREVKPEEAEVSGAFSGLRVHPAAPGAREHLIALPANHVTGRRFSGDPMGPPVW